MSQIQVFRVTKLTILHWTLVQHTLVYQKLIRQTSLSTMLCFLLGYSVALATPTTPDVSQDKPQTVETSGTVDPEKVESTTLSPVPAYALPTEPPDVHPYFHHVSPRLGSFMDIGQYGNDKILDYTLGFTYGFRRELRKQWEFGAQLISRRLGGRLMLRQKHYWSESTEKAFRPFCTVGFGIFTRPEDGLFFATELINYTGLGSIGFEKSLEKNMSWILELELGMGFRYRTAHLMLGYMWAW